MFCKHIEDKTIDIVEVKFKRYVNVKNKGTVKEILNNRSVDKGDERTISTDLVIKLGEYEMYRDPSNSY